jgi:MerR family transcriptional regulator/heat shock protein HspR
MATRPRELPARGRPQRTQDQATPDRRASTRGRAQAVTERGTERGEQGVSSIRDPNRPRYFISIAAELASVHPRTLRIYEEEGLLCPQRRNNLRLYSEADIQRVRIIRFLTRRQGVNLAGVKVILQLEAIGKIRVYDLFDADDVERFAEEGEGNG